MLGINKKQIEITISNNTIVRALLLLVGTLLFLQLLQKLQHPLTLILVSLFLTLALNPIVHWFVTKLKSKSRIRATAIAYSIVVSILTLFVILVVPPLVSQTTEFIRDVPETLSEIKNQDSTLGNFVRQYELEEQVGNLADDWARNLGNVRGPVVSTANRIFSNVISIVTVFVLTFMMLIEGPRWIKAFWKRVPKEHRKQRQEIAERMYRVVTNYFVGQVVVAAIGAFFSMLALIIVSTIIGVSINAVALAGIVFLFSLIPTVGTILASVLVALFSLFVSPLLAVIMIVYFIVYQQIENATIQPYIQSRGNELTPLIVFIAAILGFSVGGVLGGFLAIPIAGCIKILLNEWLKNRYPILEEDE